MPESITAERTSRIISFVRRNIGDRGYKKFESNEHFYDIGNDIIDEIIKENNVLKEDVVIKLAPNRYYYDDADIVEELASIVRYDKVFLRYSDKRESQPLILVTQERFEKERKNLLTSIVPSNPNFLWFPDLANSMKFDINPQRYYYIDENYGLYYWKPVIDSTSQMIIKCTRTMLEGERMNDENNPPINRRYDKFIRAGILKELCSTSTDPNLRNQAKYWEAKYAGYWNENLPLTKDMAVPEYKEF